MKGLTVLAGVVVALAAPSVAHPAVGVSVRGDVLEERPVTFIASGSTDATNRVYAKLRQSGKPCAATFNDDEGAVLFSGAESGATATATPEDAGTWIVCAYLGARVDDAKEAATIPVEIRSNRATLTIAAPATVDQNARLRLTITGTTELDRLVSVYARPASLGPCAASQNAERPEHDLLPADTYSGSFTVPGVVARGIPEPGTYRICGYVHEGSDDAEAAATATTTVRVPIPVISGLKTALTTFTAVRQTQIRYSLNTTATVTFTVRRKGGGPVLRTFKHTGRPRTVNTVPFRGRDRRNRALPPGSYVLTASPRSSAGTGRAKRWTFVVRRRA